MFYYSIREEENTIGVEKNLAKQSNRQSGHLVPLHACP
jgi:hypothetical protein